MATLETFPGGAAWKHEGWYWWRFDQARKIGWVWHEDDENPTMGLRAEEVARLLDDSRFPAGARAAFGAYCEARGIILSHRIPHDAHGIPLDVNLYLEAPPDEWPEER